MKTKRYKELFESKPLKATAKNWIYQLRLKHNLTQTEMGRECGVVQSEICKVENGKRPVGAWMLSQMRKSKMIKLNVNKLIDQGVL